MFPDTTLFMRTSILSISHQYRDDNQIASAKFTFDLSPMSVILSERRIPLYHFLTSVCAIIGGVFTVIGLFDSVVFMGLNSLAKKQELGKQCKDFLSMDVVVALIHG